MSKIRFVDQFKLIKEKKGKTKQNASKGPIDIKAARAQVKEWNAKNRKPQ